MLGPQKHLDHQHPAIATVGPFSEEICVPTLAYTCRSSNSQITRDNVRRGLKPHFRPQQTAHAPTAMIRDFEAWNANIGELSELQELSGCRVAIEAAHYLQHRILSHPRAREPLVPALGGLPLGMKQYIEEDLNTFESLQIEPWFVFSGLDITKPDDPFQQKQREAGVNTMAWNLYDSNQAEASVAKFGESTYVTPEDLFRFLQSILIERKVHFQIAPYSAWAQVRLHEA